MDESVYIEEVRSKVYTIRGVQVMLDSDLAEIFGYETRELNQQVKRNITRFPEDFMFQLSAEEINSVISQNVTSRSVSWFSGQSGGNRKLPYVFTEQGVYMLATVLHGEVAARQSIYIMRAFRQMRKFLFENAQVFQRIERLEIKQHEMEFNFKEIFKKLENSKEAKSVLFFKGQLWDAMSLIEDIIGRADDTIVLIDNYVDRKTLDLLSRKKDKVKVFLYTSEKGNRITKSEMNTFNVQYGKLDLKMTDEFHDRFLVLDGKMLYHIGASLKDAGKKAFEISLIEEKWQLKAILDKLESDV